MNAICPCCKRSLPRISAKSPVSKKLAQDLARCEAAISALQSFDYARVASEYTQDTPTRRCTVCDSAFLTMSHDRECKGKTTYDVPMPESALALFLEARDSEIARLSSALTDHALLWRIYRRADKGPSYVPEVTEVIEVAA
jgi:hypothetical protein